MHFATGEPYEQEQEEGGSLPVLKKLPPGERLLAWSLRAGDCLAFHGRAVHGGRGSFGRSVSLRYLGDGVVVGGLNRRFAVPTAWSMAAGGGLPEGVEDGVPLDHPALAWEDPLFGLRASTPVSVQEWPKGVAVNEEELDDWSGRV